MQIKMTVTSADPRREEIGRAVAEAIRQRFNTLDFTMDVQIMGLQFEDRGSARYTGGQR